MTTLTDWRGKTIAPGAVVLYVGRHGSTVYVTEGTVLEVGSNGRAIRVRATGGTGYVVASKPSTLTALKNVTVLEEA